LSDFESDGELALMCLNCETDALCPTHGFANVIAVIGMSIILDPPSAVMPAGFLPPTIECRKCGSIYSKEGVESDVRQAL
jgi:hypothetical protein